MNYSFPAIGSLYKMFSLESSIIYPVLTQQVEGILYVRHYMLLQCLIFHCRPLSRRSPARPASLSWLLRVTIPGAFHRPAGDSCCVENLNSSVYVYHANLQLQ